MSLYVPGQFAVEVSKAVQHFGAVSKMLDAQQADSADFYMEQVLQAEGRRIYEAVLAMVAAERGIPPKDVPRPL